MKTAMHWNATNLLAGLIVATAAALHALPVVAVASLFVFIR